jgi:two-component system, cell cycle sensor histidine kinase and response regulator CckA
MATKKGDGKGSKSAGSGKAPSRASAGKKIHDYRVWLECLNEGVWVVDKTGHVTYANPRMAEILGYPIEEITGRHIFAFMDEQGKKSSLEYEQRRIKGIRERHDFEFIQKNGERIYTSIESAPLFDGKGKYQGIVAAVQDITWQRQAEEKLKQSDERYRTLFDNPVEAIYIHDFEGNFIDANDTALALLGYKRDEIRGVNFAELLDPEGVANAIKYIGYIRKTGSSSIKVGHKLKRKDGAIVYVETSGSLLFRDGKPFAILGIARDITENKRTAEALSISEERYRLLVENSDQGILVVQDTLIKWVNTKLSEITQYPADELLTRPFIEFIHPDDRAMVFDRHRKRLKGEQVPRKYSFRLVNKPGEVRWVEISAVSSQWEGRPATLNFLSDVTERFEAEEALRDSYLQYQNIIEFLPDPTFVVDTRGTVIAWNRAIEEITGSAKKDMIGKGNYEYSIPFYGERRKILIDYILENAPDTELRYVNIRRVGDILYGETLVPKLRGGKGAYCFGKASLLYNSKGELTGAIEGIRDTTEIKMAEQALQESEKKYRDIFDNSLDGIFQSSPEGKFISVNKAMARMFGVETPEEMLSIISDIPYQLYANPARRKEMVKVMMRDGSVNNFEVEFLNKDGQKIWVSLNARAVKDEAGNLLRYEGTIKDISKRKRAEEELHNIQVMQKATLESTADGIIVTDLEGNIRLTNRRFAEIWHFPPEIIQAGHTRALMRYAWKDMEDPEDFLQRARKITQSGEMESSIVRFKDGRILERFSTPLIVNREVAGRMASYRDVTDIHRMEEELYRTQKLDSLGILAGGIAHDFNNILTGILGNITLARMEAKPDTGMFSILEEAEKAAIRAKDLTQQLLTFARGGAPIRKTASVPEILRDTVQFALRGSKSSCDFLIPDDLWSAEIDRGQISQVINNMVINSDEAMPQGGSITIKAENAVIKEDDVASLIPGRYIKITISDTGLGMPEEHISRVFDPYFTTKQKGSGLGLATSYSIIKNHGGTITVSSRLGAGSAFNIFIPASEERVKEQTATQKTQLSRKGRILVMDDEAMVLEVATRMLRHIGFSDIHAASNGKDAVDAYRKSVEEGNPFTVVIMDLTVPGGMGGEEAVKSLLEINPAVKVIVSSGYSSGPVLSDYKSYGFSAVVGKPYTVDELAHALDEAINK